MSKKNQCNLFPYLKEECFSIQEVKQNIGWNITAFDLPSTWHYSQGEGIVIAVIDTGCQLDHPDLKNNLLNGYNFVENNKEPVDENSHGTHITGILVAENNDIGMVGVCPKAKVMPLQALDKNGNGNMLNISNAIRYAADNGADFISMSFGAPIPVPQVRSAIRYALRKGVITFVAAGNAGNTRDVYYPAAYPETIAVGAVNLDMRRADFSNTGKNLDFMAPGVDIYSTVPNSWYAKMSGTSMAQPFVCGVAALIKSYVINQNKRPDISLKTPQDYIRLMMENTTPISDIYDNPRFYQGYGIIDPRKFTESIHNNSK